MMPFYMTLFSTYIFALVARLNKNKITKRPEILLSIYVVVILIVISGARHGIGDTYAYSYFYEIVGNRPNLTVAIEEGKESYEPGFITFLWILNQISKDPQLMVFACALVTNFLNIWTMRIYSKVFELETYMYITSGFYVVTMNGIRQALASAILFAATKYIIEGKFKRYLIVVLLAYTIHSSALIMIPVYFIVRCEAWSKITIKIIVIAAVALICLQPIMTKFFEASEGTKYEAYQDTMAVEGGASPIRTVISAIPVVLAYIYRDKLKKQWPESNVFVNMSLICLIISVFSMINWVFNRFNMYFQIYSFLVLPYIILNCFEKKQKGLVYFGFMVCYFIFFYFETAMSQGVSYTSNYLNF